MNDQHTLPRGKLQKVPIGFRKVLFTHLKKSLLLMYCGMPSENNFCIGVMFPSGYQGYSLPVYFRREEKEILIMQHRFKVANVTQEQLILEHIKKNDYIC